MKLRCPHCQVGGLKASGLLLSGAANPTRCEGCGQLSFANQWLTLGMDMLATPVVACCILWAVYAWSWWPLVVILVLGPVRLLGPAFLPATPTTQGKARRARWIFVTAIVVLVLGVVAAGVAHEF